LLRARLLRLCPTWRGMPSIIALEWRPICCAAADHLPHEPAVQIRLYDALDRELSPVTSANPMGSSPSGEGAPNVADAPPCARDRGHSQAAFEQGSARCGTGAKWLDGAIAQRGKRAHEMNRVRRRCQSPVSRLTEFCCGLTGDAPFRRRVGACALDAGDARRARILRVAHG